MASVSEVAPTPNLPSGSESAVDLHEVRPFVPHNGSNRQYMRDMILGINDGILMISEGLFMIDLQEIFIGY